MSRIVFVNIHAHGHTNPTLGVVRELIHRGHEVIYFSFEAMRERIEGTGATFIPCDQYVRGMEPTREEGAKLGSDLALASRILVDTTLALAPVLRAEFERLQPDCIVADSMAVWGRLLARQMDIPVVTSTTTFAFNSHVARSIMEQGIPALVKFLVQLPGLRREMRRLREAGFPVRGSMDLVTSDEDLDTVVYTSAEFQPASDTFPKHFSFVGPSVRPVTTTVTKQRDTLVYVSMGTVNNDMAPFYRACIEAFGRTRHQVILSVGDQVDPAALGPVPDNVTVAASVDQIAVLGAADVFVSHCGMNSVNESLWFGVPLVMLPRTSEQAGVAERVRQVGAGIRLKGTDADKVVRTVERLLGDPSYRRAAERIRDGFHRCSGAVGAADAILGACAKAAGRPRRSES
ncbi:hypothetical protein I6B53_00655 [Schaalia sp. 19OD2882]|uniref:macrolide family glycosyltransferase n=1 Tax=Schaalia sp. 19OD2882 TaxID=2794089 RepID=UPI001C1F1CB3|nr:macrolide family glycosyltransferase [Schaalia sp. 19OD2882]QWW19688.1 hypothetical protein I6B53_00655 [Schaalia sp. 19OD2882]